MSLLLKDSVSLEMQWKASIIYSWFITGALTLDKSCPNKESRDVQIYVVLQMGQHW